MNKLIKIKNDYYIVDDSEIKDVRPYLDKYYYDLDNKIVLV